MILKPLPVHRTNDFSWHPEYKEFLADSSELRWRKGWPELGRVYDDACDEGFTLVSDRTGKEMVLALEEVDENDDYSGGWRTLTFVPADPRHRGDFRVTVFND